MKKHENEDILIGNTYIFSDIIQPEILLISIIRPKTERIYLNSSLTKNINITQLLQNLSKQNNQPNGPNYKLMQSTKGKIFKDYPPHFPLQQPKRLKHDPTKTSLSINQRCLSLQVPRQRPLWHHCWSVCKVKQRYKIRIENYSWGKPCLTSYLLRTQDRR